MIVRMSQFDKIIEGLFKKKSATGIVGLDIGSSFVKAIQVHKKGGKAVLDTYGEIALGPLQGLEVGQVTQLPVDKIAEAVIDLFNEAKITSRDIVISLPLTSALLTVIELPDLGETKTKEMIPIEARKYIPTSVSEVSLNWWIIPHSEQVYIDPDDEDSLKNSGPKVDVLLAAVHNDVIERYKQIGQKIGAKSLSFEIEVFSAIRTTLGHDSSLAMIVDLGSANTKVVIVEDGIVRSSTLINSGAQDITFALARSRGVTMLEAEETKRTYGLSGKPEDPTVAEVTRIAVERIVAEVGRIHGKYERVKHVTINNIHLSGGGALLKGIPELMKATFAQANVQVVRSFKSVEAPAVLEGLLDEAGPEFTIALGLAFRKLN
jgi:type IV pilus assembly protein PilM